MPESDVLADVIGHAGLDYAEENPRGSMTVKTLLVMVATMLFAWLLAAGLTLLIGAHGGVDSARPGRRRGHRRDPLVAEVRALSRRPWRQGNGNATSRYSP
jgi:hypothetical protein